jgi:hypothetical protein
MHPLMDPTNIAANKNFRFIAEPLDLDPFPRGEWEKSPRVTPDVIFGLRENRTFVKIGKV